MKLFLPFISLIFFFTISKAQLPPESDPHRGMYIDGFVKNPLTSNSVLDPVFSILGVDTNADGIFEKEDAYLNYACENHITYLALYDLGKIFGRNTTAWNENTHQYEKLEKHLCRFMHKARASYGITQIGCIGGSANQFDSMLAFMNRYPLSSDPNCEDCGADFDVLNVEYEFWGNNCAGEIQNFIPIIEKMYSVKQAYNAAHPDNPMITEAYIAFIYYCTNPGISTIVEIMDGCKTCSPYPGFSNPHPRLVDRILYTMTDQNPANVSFIDQNQYENPLTYDSTDFHPMLYSEATHSGGERDFMGPWLVAAPQNTIFFAEEYYYYKWLNNSGAALGQPQMNDVQPGGVHWFAASHMVGVLDHPKVIQTPGAFCATDSAKIILNYYGPDEPGTDYEFYITDDANGSTVYPASGGIFSGTSIWTVNNAAYRSINFSDSTIFPPLYLPPGNYTAHIQLKYNHSTGCTYLSSWPILVDNRPRLQVTGDTAFCYGSNSFVNAPAGGTYYTWYKNGNLYYAGPTNSIQIRETGNYSCEITGNVCSAFTDTVHLTAHPMPNAQINAVCNGNNTVTLKADLQAANPSSTETSGWGGITYQWNNGEITDQITVISTGASKSYTLLLTDPYSGCTLLRKYKVPNPLSTIYTPNINIDLQPTGSCMSDGKLTAYLTPAPAVYDPVTYLWSNGETTSTINNLSPGTYSVAISNYRQACAVYKSVTIGTAPSQSPVMNEIITAAGCNNTATGSIVLNPSGGNPPFTFEWKHIPDENGYSTTSQDQHNLFPGVYPLTVKDVNGCSFNFSYRVGKGSGLILISTTSVNEVTGCSDNNNGSAVIQITGGNAPYDEIWDDLSGNILTSGDSLHSGSYKVTITDDDGCTGYSYIHIPADNLPLRSHLLDSSITELSCVNSYEGSLFVCVHGGSSPYALNSPWEGDSGLAYMDTLTAGTYSLTITDAMNCMLTDSFTITSSDLSITVNAQPTTCIGCNDGQAQLIFSGGLQPYTISWSPQVGVLNGNTIEQLPAGNYSACITDSLNCQVCFPFDILNDPLSTNNHQDLKDILIYPNPAGNHITIEIGSKVSNNCRIKIFDVFGRNCYQNKLSGNKTSDFQLNLTDGIYFVSIEDENLKLIYQQKLLIRK